MRRELQRFRPSGARRAVVLGIVLLLVLICTATGLALAITRCQVLRIEPTFTTREVVVVPGDTLWHVARRHASIETDLRAAVDDIMAMNRLSGSGLHPGQVLLVRTPLNRE